jgi:hypothetical protein
MADPWQSTLLTGLAAFSHVHVAFWADVTAQKHVISDVKNKIFILCIE